MSSCFINQSSPDRNRGILSTSRAFSNPYDANFDELVKSQKPSVFVISANAGIQDNQVFMDPRSPIVVEDKLRGGDGLGDFLRDHQL